MYAKHFGLRELPFNNTPDPRFFYPTPDHEEALATLIYAVGEGKGYVLLTGEVGTGKTLISRLMLRHFDGRIAFATVNHAVESARDLLHLVCAELEIDVRGDETAARLIHTLQTFLLERFATRVPVVLVLDEAQNLPRDAFELLRTIGNLESDDAKLLQVVIVGQPELRTRFQAADMRQLGQRLFRTFHLPALSREQCGAYIRHRVHVAGGTTEIFEESAIDAIHHQAGGLPRLINTLCDNALLSAYSTDRTTVDGSFVESVVRQMMPIEGNAVAVPAPAEPTCPTPEPAPDPIAAPAPSTEPAPQAQIEDDRYARVLSEGWQATLTRLEDIERALAEQADDQRSATSATACGLDAAATKLTSLEQDLAGVQEQASQGAATANTAVRQVSHLQEYVAGSDRRYEQAIEGLVSKAIGLEQRTACLETLAQALHEARRAAGSAFAQSVGEPGPSVPDGTDKARLSVPIADTPWATLLGPDERVGRLMKRVAEAERQIENIDAWVNGVIRRGDSQAKAIRELEGTAGRARRLAGKAFDRATRAQGSLRQVDGRMSDLADQFAPIHATADRVTAEQQSIRARLTAITHSSARTRQVAEEAMKEAARTAYQSRRVGEEIGKLVRQIEPKDGPANPTAARTNRPRLSARHDTNERLRQILERSRASVGNLQGMLDGTRPDRSATAGFTPGETLARDLTQLASVLGA